MNNQINLKANAQTEQLKQSLVRQFIQEHAELGARLVNQVVNEAYALASMTFVPQLVLPALAEEKVRDAATWAAHQRSILHANGHQLAA